MNSLDEGIGSLSLKEARPSEDRYVSKSKKAAPRKVAMPAKSKNIYSVQQMFAAEPLGAQPAKMSIQSKATRDLSEDFVKRAPMKMKKKAAKF